MNTPNKLTIARIIATPVFMAALMIEFPYHYTAALLLFAGAGKPVLVLGDKAVDELFFDAVGGADDGISVAVQLQGHRTALGANQRIARHSPI